MANQSLKEPKWAMQLVATTIWARMEPVPGQSVNRILIQNLGSQAVIIAFDPIDYSSHQATEAILPASVTEIRTYDRVCNSFIYRSDSGTSNFIIEGWTAANT